MYVVYFGTDRKAVRDAATKYIDENMPAGGQLTTVDENSFQTGQVADALGATSLFGGEEWFVFDVPSSNPDFLEEVTASLSDMKESSNNFIILENALLAPAKKTYSKFTDFVAEFAAKKGDGFNIFSLTEALASKDKRKLWLLLQEARLNGLRDEEIIGVLWWQLKTLRLAALTKNSSEAGMKDFPYNKAKRSLSIFKEGEVTRLSQTLLELYHDGHGGLRDMDTALEKWVLEI